MSGEYTNRDQNWKQEWQILLDQRVRPLPPDYPTPKYELAFEAVTQGVPLAGKFNTPMTETIQQNAYNNYPAVESNQNIVETKFAKEEWRSYHIHFFRFLFHFIYGIIINPIQWAFDKGKGRICVDCTNGNDPEGSANTYIPSPSDENVRECPAVFYQYAFMDYINMLYRMRQSEPDVPILQHADDIDSAFRQIIYNPELAAAFAYVFNQYVIIPVGQVFGSRSAPSFYCLLADVRQALIATLPVKPPEQLNALVIQCNIILNDSLPLVHVSPDSHHPPLNEDDKATPYGKSFVDDTAIAAYLQRMRQHLNNSVTSAFCVFGAEGTNRQGDCLRETKWSYDLTEEFLFWFF